MFRKDDGVARVCQPVSAARTAKRDGFMHRSGDDERGEGRTGMLCVGSLSRKTENRCVPALPGPDGRSWKVDMLADALTALPHTQNRMPPTDNSTVDARYPIGTFVRADHYTGAERAAFIERLVAQPAAMAAAVSGLSADQLNCPYRAGGWTIRQLVHHVADSHVHMYIRVKLALSADEPLINAYDQDAWVLMADVTAVSPLVSLSIIATIHERVVAIFRSLSQADFERGIMHPENGRMTVEQVLATYAWHGDHHIAHIRAAKAALR